MPLFPLCFDRSNLFFSRIFKGFNFRFPFTTQHDIRTTTRHVGSNSYCTGASGLGNNFRFLGVKFRVKNLMLDTRFVQATGHFFRSFDRCGTHQNRSIFSLVGFDIFNDCIVFFFYRKKHKVIKIDPLHRFVGRNYHHIQAINFAEFVSFCICSTRHTSEQRIQAEIILEGC